MSILRAEGICKSFGAQRLLSDISLVLQPGERVGLLGRNGTGKSTLAKILGGQVEADGGRVHVQKEVSIHYLAQEPNLDPQTSVREAVAGGLGPWVRARKAFDEVSGRLEGCPQEEMSALLEEQAEVEAEIQRLGGWDQEHEAEKMLQRLGVDQRDEKVGRLSGGELRRVALARLLVARPRLAILDEPTNHLDVATIEWLEGHLRDVFDGALLFITHDRYLLDAVAHRILELEGGGAA